ncbi:MAG TPA: Bax inhibitor-1/YccA family protein [Terriglobia bacterium]|nr:Bax inhibitor-1/YccA family protein [Terriglobia bacterium]
MRSANPALNPKTFTGLPAVGAEPMTLQRTVNKTAALLICVFATAAWTWSRVGAGEEVGPWVFIGAIGGFVTALVTVFKKNWSPVTAPIYALLEGLVIGGFSAMLDQQFHGIAMQAAGLTFGTLLCLLLAYSSGMIRVSENFKLGVVAATGGIMLVYLVSMFLGFFGHTIPFIHDNGAIGIGFSFLVVGVAAMNLVLDFDLIESAALRGAPKYMEWYGAFGLMVTLIWLYIEILRLLSKLRSRR